MDWDVLFFASSHLKYRDIFSLSFRHTCEYNTTRSSPSAPPSSPPTASSRHPIHWTLATCASHHLPLDPRNSWRTYTGAVPKLCLGRARQILKLRASFPEQVVSSRSQGSRFREITFTCRTRTVQANDLEDRLRATSSRVALRQIL